MVTIRKNGNGHVIEMANRATVQKLSNESVSGLTMRLDNHESGLNANAHGISNIAGLVDDLNAIVDEVNNKTDIGHTHSKDDILDLVGYTGTKVVVTGVNFSTQVVTTATINVVDGIITNIT